MIRRADLDGTNVAELVVDLDGPAGIALDLAPPPPDPVPALGPLGLALGTLVLLAAATRALQRRRPCSMAGRRGV